MTAPLLLLLTLLCCAALGQATTAHHGSLSLDTRAFQCLTAYARQVDQLSDSVTASSLHRLWHELANLSHSSPRPKSPIVGLGPGTTGTHSLMRELQQRGVSCSIHWANPLGGCCKEERAHWISMLLPSKKVGGSKLTPMMDMTTADIWEKLERTFATDCFGFVVDSPVASLFLHLYHFFPDAKFIWTDRESSAWASSRMANHGTTEIDLIHTQPRQQDAWRFLSRPEKTQAFKRAFEAIRELVFCIVEPQRILKFSYFDDDAQQIKNAITTFLA